jgi:hypothetical protein
VSPLSDNARFFVREVFRLGSSRGEFAPANTLLHSDALALSLTLSR